MSRAHFARLRHRSGALLLGATLFGAPFALVACGSSEPEPVAETEPAETAPEPTLDPARAAQIETLLAKAATAVEEGRIESPENDSASFYYDLVLALDPTNDRALLGKENLLSDYVRLAEDAWKAGDESKKHEYLGRAAALSASDPELVAARARLAGSPPAPASPPAALPATAPTSASAPAPAPAPKAKPKNSHPGGGGYANIHAAKVGYRRGDISRDEYDRIVRYYRVRMDEALKKLKRRYRAGEISKGTYRDQARAIERRFKG